ncbi:general stress protein [Aneurinibacillus sp. BA2021]|nr:general stress protein [Aneurinibacillus sp. BA2021]
MEGKLVEVFNTEEQALRAIEDWKQRGYDNDDISVLAKDEGDIASIQDAADVSIETDFTRKRESNGMLDDIFSVFKGDRVGYYSSDEVEGRLLREGIPEDKVQEYRECFDEGKILVMLDAREGGTGIMDRSLHTNHRSDAAEQPV